MRATTMRPLVLAATAAAAAAAVATGMLTGAGAAQAATGPARGTGLTGACNMLHDPTMATVPMSHDAAQGNAGMYHAVDVSGCS